MSLNCPRCKESNPDQFVETALTWGCKTCGYSEDAFSTPVVGFQTQKEGTLPNSVWEINYER